jgi:hypothetical protein
VSETKEKKEGERGKGEEKGKEGDLELLLVTENLLAEIIVKGPSLGDEEMRLVRRDLMDNYEEKK